MSEAEATTPLGPYSFALSQEDMKAAASRAGLRAALAGRLSLNHVAPLVAFGLCIVFIAILAFTGLVSRRFGEAALILAAIAFMAARMTAHWRLRGAQKDSLAAMIALQQAGPIVVQVEDSCVRMTDAQGIRRVFYADCDAADDDGGIVYLWKRKGAPAFIPAHAFPNEQAAQEFLTFIRSRIRRAAETSA